MLSSDKVLFFCAFPPPVSGQTVATSLYCKLIASEFHTLRIDIADTCRNKRQNAFPFSRIKKMAGHTYELRKTVQKERPDVLYVVLSSSVLGHLRDVAYILSARPYVKRVVAHIHVGNYHCNFERPWHQYLTRKLIDNVDTFCFLSQHLSERSSPTIPEDKVSIVPNTTDAYTRFTEEEVDSKLRRRKHRDKICVVYISNMIPSKGYMDLARGIASYCEGEKSSPIEAHFVGEWPSEEARGTFMSFLERNRIDALTHVHGAVRDRHRIKKLLQGADVFSLPTYYPHEAQPISIIEALNAGTPVIATRHASIPEYVFDGRNGYLVDKRSPEQIADGLRKLTDQQNWTDKAREARRTYWERFSPNAVKESLLNAIAG